MSKRTLELLAFLLSVAGIVARASLTVKKRRNNEKLRQPIKQLRAWFLKYRTLVGNRSFFKALEGRTSKIGMLSLRRTALPDNDLEMRFWYDHFEVINGVIRRSADKWSATYLSQRNTQEPLSTPQESLGAPKSGWETAWKRLTDADILKLPDGSVNCKTEVLDGVSYVVETNVNRRYRTYRYGNPSLANYNEAKQIVMIEAILSEELQIPPPPK